MRQLMEKSQIVLDLLDHFGVAFLGEVHLTGVHLENAAPFIAAFILRYEMHVQMAAGIAISAVVHLAGSKGLVQSLGGLVHIGKKGVAFFFADIYDLADVILVGHDHPAGLALLLKKDQAAYPKIADVNTEFFQQLAAHTVAAVMVFHRKAFFLFSFIIPQPAPNCNAILFPQKKAGAAYAAPAGS